MRPIEIEDVSQGPLPPELTESVDENVDRALDLRPYPIALLANEQAEGTEVRAARADYRPRLAVRSDVSLNIGSLRIERGPVQNANDSAGQRLGWGLFERSEAAARAQAARAEAWTRAAAFAVSNGDLAKP